MDRLLVVLDLDETLIHASTNVDDSLADFRSGPYRCMIRPGALEFVSRCLDRYDVGVWTSAGSLHAESVVTALFPDPSRLVFMWSSQQCTKRRNWETDELVEAKNLKKVERLGYSLGRVVAVDDSPEKHEQNFGNLLRVSAWMGEPDDSELADVGLYLAWLSAQPNVRSIEKRGWRSLRSWR